MHNVSVILCAYTEDRLQDLLAAIESVQQQSQPADEIIVVIDHNPKLLKAVHMHSPGVIVAENKEVPCLSGARNSGLALAQGKIIAFLDDDTLASPDWLKLLCEGFSDARVLGVGGTVHPLWQDQAPAWLPEEFYWVVGCTYRGLPGTVTAIRNPIGANMSFRREVFETVGGFRNDIGRVGTLPAGCEETELCIRAAQHWPERMFLYQPDAYVSHRVIESRTRWRYFCSRCYAEGLSKAVVTRYVGMKDTLSSETIYILKTLPLGLMRNLLDTLLHRDMSALLRVGVIIAGLAVTTAGYLVGSILAKTGLGTSLLQKRLPVAA